MWVMKRVIPILSTLLLGEVAMATAVAGPITENVLVPFTGGISAVQTTNFYTGGVLLFITGTGQAAGTQHSDAFYVYTDSMGNPLNGTPGIGVNLPGPWHANTTTTPFNWTLWINAKDAALFVSFPCGLTFAGGCVPAFNPAHDYLLEIDLGSQSGPITFGVGDLFTADNTGSYSIFAQQVPEPTSMSLVAVAVLAVVWRHRMIWDLSRFIKGIKCC